MAPPYGHLRTSSSSRRRNAWRPNNTKKPMPFAMQINNSNF
jgi:hypothetical protein